MAKYDFLIKPSGSVEGYFVHQCERNILFNSLSLSQISSFGLNRPTGSGSSIAARAGIDRETEVVEKLIDPKYLIAGTGTEKGRKIYHKYTPKETMEKIAQIEQSVRADKASRYLYQACLEATPERKKQWFKFDETLYTGKNDKLNVSFTEAYPDLIRADWNESEECVILSVIDIKLSKRMKLSHKVQVTLYIKLLKDAIDEYNKENPDDKKNHVKVNEAEGYLWNGGQDHERPFSLKETDELLEDYFENVIRSVVENVYAGIKDGREKTIKDNVTRCVGPKCEWCENCWQCLGELKKTGSTSVIPHLSAYAQEYARRIKAPDEISALKTYVEDEYNKKILSCNRSWDLILNDGTTIETQAAAVPFTWKSMLSTGHRWKNRKSLTMPRWQDVAIILTAQKYAGDGRIYALGFMIRTRDKDKDIEKVFIASDNSDNAYMENVRSFVNTLYDHLKKSDEHNRNYGEKEKLTLQGYVMDSYEKINLEEVLYDVLENETDMGIKEKTMEILFWLQGERLVAESEDQPELESEYPLIILNSELKKLLSLPVAVSYRIPDVLAAMNVWIDVDKRFNAAESDLFFEYTSNVMKSDAIHSYWTDNVLQGKKQAKAQIKKQIEDHIQKRLYAQAQILIKMQNEGRDQGHLVRNLSPFVMPQGVDYHTELLRKWFFEIKLENLLAYHKIRSTRLQGVDETVQTGDALKMKISDVVISQNSNGYTETSVTLETVDPDIIFREEWFSMILSEAKDEDIAELYKFDDYKNSNIFPRFSSDNKVAILNFAEYERNGSSLRISGIVNGRRFETGDISKTVYVVPRYTDLNSSKIFRRLKRIDDGEDAALIHPADLEQNIASDYDKVKNELLAYSRPDDLGFTISQENAFRHLYENSLTVLQGPPGTGKTDFIARAVITLCRYYHNVYSRDLRVLISANSHAAIENVLFMIDKKTGNDTDIRLYKSSRFDSDDPAARSGKVILVSDSIEDNTNFFEKIKEGSGPIVLGATNWSCSKLHDIASENGEDWPFDLIVIDEASQVRVMDAMLSLGMGDTESTRYLLVGDGDQLPAIIQGRYGKDTGNSYEYGSVFDFYREQICDNRLMLAENFRMNEILLRYSAETIYSDAYRSFNDEIASRRLKYKDSAKSMGDITEYIFDGYSNNDDAYWPLVFCRISGGTPIEQNNAEVMLTSLLTKAIKANVVYDPADEKMLWKGDGAKDGVLGIVSPHHRHIEQLKDRICSDTGMARDTLYIGTVDKLQGQQREAVIVSYGVTDLESAVTEGEFIFNRNRLNVALTRAKCKIITVFSEILTKVAPGMLDTEDEDLQHGIEYVCGFSSFMQRTEPDTEIDHKEFSLKEEGCENVIVDIYRKRIRK